MAAKSRQQVRRTKGSVILRPAPARGRGIARGRMAALESARGRTMTDARREREAASEAVEDLTATSLDKVREILFGQEMRKNDQRFSKIEERLLKELSALGTETKKRLDALDNVSRAEIDGLSKSLKLEQAEREALTKELGRASTEMAKALDKKLSQIDAQFVKSLREAQAELSSEVRALRDEVKKSLEESANELNTRARQIQATKIDRGQLAALLIDLAQSLEKDKPGR
jgi:hypothetical protein